MNLFAVFIFLCVLCKSQSSDVVVLNSDTFKDTISSEENMLVEFYAPWCGHCQALEPEYEKAASALKEQGIKLGKVDATQEEKLAEKYGVSGYPTIKLFKKGEVVKDYKGPRTSEGIVKYMSNVQEGKEEDEEEEGGDGDGEYGAGEGEGEAEAEGGAGASSTEDPVGLVNLDAFTFDKLVGTNKFDIFVKIDSSYAYGDKENEWAKLSQRVANLTSSRAREFLLGVVGVEDYGDKLNDDLRQRLNVRTEDFPVFKLFKRDAKDPIEYQDAVEADAMSQFLSLELGLWIGRTGCLEEFDRLAYGFAIAADTEREKRLTNAAALAEASNEDVKQTSAYYVRVMRKTAEQGAVFPQKEATRIEKLIESKITEEKKAEMSLRLNILASFGAKLVKKEKEKAADEKSTDAEEDDA